MNEIEPDKTEPEAKTELARGEGGKFIKKEPITPKEPEVKTEPEVPPITDEDYKKQIEELNTELLTLRTFKANRLKEIDDFEQRLKAQQLARQTKEDQKIKGFKEEKQSEGDKTVIPPLYGKMSFKNLTEKTKEMRKK